MKPAAIVGSIFVTALLAGTVAQADVIFDNFGPGDAYNSIPSPQADYDTNWVTSGNLFNKDIATKFGTVATTQYLTSVDLAISEAGSTDTAYIYLMSGTPEPTALVDVAVTPGLPTYTGVEQPPISVPFDSYALVPGETYWIVLSTVDIDGSEILWGTNSIGMTDGYSTYVAINLVGSWTMYQGATPAMRINVASEAVSTTSESWGTLKALFR